jgi:hypothetical protein
MALEKQMELFDEGGLLDEGGTVDEESGNEVPTGSLKKEVRDDIPAKLSEGEFVMPADVVRYHGLDKMMSLRDEAKMGLQRMEDMGQMGNAEEAIIPDGIPFGLEDLDIAEEPMEMQVGGFVPGIPQIPQQSPYGVVQQPPGQNIYSVPSQFQQPVAIPFQQPYFAPTQSPVMPVFGPGQPTGEPKETFTFDEMMPTVGGTSETREYRNADGESLYIPFINGEPIYPIPAGYFPYTPEAAPDPTPDPVTTTGQTVREEDPSDGREFGGDGLTPTQSKVASISQLDPNFANKVNDINSKYKTSGFSILGTIVNEFKKTNEINRAIDDYDYTSLGQPTEEQIKAGKGNTLTEDEVRGVVDTLAREIQSGYRDPETGEVSGQKDSRNPLQRIGDFLGGLGKEEDFGDEFGNIAPDGTMPTTTRVETTTSAKGTASSIADAAISDRMNDITSRMDKLGLQGDDRLEFLDAIANQRQVTRSIGTNPNTGDPYEITFNPRTEAGAAAADMNAANNLIDAINKDTVVSTADETFLTPATTKTNVEPAVNISDTIISDAKRNQQLLENRQQEEEDRQTQNYINKGYTSPKAKAAAKNKVAADARAKQEARDRGDDEDRVNKTSAVTDSSGKPVTSTNAKGEETVVTSGPPPDDPEPSKIVCTEMYRQTQLDDWKQAIRIWGVHQKKYLTPYHEIGYHWLFKPWVKGMRKSVILTSVGAYLAKARTQHLRYVLTHGKAKDNIVGNIWCKIVHPLTYIAGRIKEWLKL